MRAMSNRPIDVREKLSPREFVQEYIVPNKPVIVSDALDTWRARELWTPEYFLSLLGTLPVEVTRDGPDPEGRMPYSEFYEHLRLAQTGPVPEDGSIQHLRYMRMREMAPLEQVRGQWARPYFMPKRGYCIPFAPLGLDPTRERYPGFGLFISPRGGASKLHVDGIRSNAIVCQVHGSKRCYVLAPDQEAQLPDRDSRRARQVKHLEFEPPSFGRAKMVEFDLHPGETLFVPHLWFHEVHTTQTSISLTYNFVHGSEALGFAWWFLKTSLTNPNSHSVG